MNLLHVGDLHLGRSIDKHSLIEDQAAILDQIVQIAQKHQVSGIILAGDVFDSPQPSEKARKLYNHFVSTCIAQGIVLYVIAGNHDSKETIEFAREPLQAVGLHTAGILQDSLRPLVHRVDPRTNDVADTTPVKLWLLPYVTRHQLARALQVCDDAAGVSVSDTPPLDDEPVPSDKIAGQSALVTTRSRLHSEEAPQSFTELVKALITRSLSWDQTPGCNILVAHQFVVAGEHHVPQTSDSEQQIYPSHIFDAIKAEAFEGMDYVALGHLHKPQEVTDHRIRYAGTPLAYSKSEANQEKSVVLIRIVDGEVSTQVCPLKPMRAVRTLTGLYDHLIQEYIKTDKTCDDYVYITLTDTEESPDHYGGLRAAYPHILGMSYSACDYEEQDERDEYDVASAPSVLEQFSRYFAMIVGHEMSDDQQRYLEQVMQTYVEGEEQTCAQ